MKKTKIIIPALGMLLLSTAASVTGTVAWFSMNRTVTAEGLQVRVSTASDLYIYNGSYSTDAWGSAPSLDTIATAKNIDVAAIANNGATQLVPSSTINYGTWFYLANSSEIATGGGIYTTNPGADKVSSIAYAEATPGAIKSYVHVSRCYVAMKDAATESKGNLSATATIAALASGDDMINVIRTAVTITDGTTPGTTQVFSADGDTATKPLSSTTSVNANAVTTTASGSAAQIYTGFSSNKVYTVTVFTWFEGQDSDCVNINTVDSGDYKIDLSFTLA